MDLLYAVNQILPALGEHSVTRVDARHPTLAVILPAIDRTIQETLLRGGGSGWWFNTHQVTWHPNSEGEIVVPRGTLQFTPSVATPAIVRGERLFNPVDMTYRFKGPVTGVWKELLKFEELPESAANYVMYTALVTVYITDIGLENVVEKWQEIAESAGELLSSEHLANVRHSTTKSRRYGRFTRALRG